MRDKSYFKQNLIKIITTALLLAVLIYIAFFWGKTEIKRRIPLKFEKEVTKYSQEYGLDKNFVYAVICAESGFDENAVSQKGAKGLMQIMPETASWLKKKYKMDIDETALFDPETNIHFGCIYFKYLFERFNGDRKLVLAAYNGGEGNVRKWLQNPLYSKDGINLTNIPYKETANYVKKVSVYQTLYEKTYQ